MNYLERIILSNYVLFLLLRLSILPFVGIIKIFTFVIPNIIEELSYKKYLKYRKDSNNG